MDAARKKQGLRSDRALGRKMKLSQKAVSYWRTGRTFPSEVEMQRLAQLAGSDESQALILLNVWRAKDERTRDNFRRLLQFFGPEGGAVIAVALAVALSAAANPESPGVERTANNLTVQLPALYIMR
jgi:transcriptional regulator with XRE-family HTH domain